ncbi:Ribosome-releasing factor 2, mitochondrial [Thelotrema lepadinum]|nr:Ribosome-releasing factor 2, mitochondrial [Thelotrema lepadinum]
MLYYSGHTKRLGNVDEGSTVTDFLPLERARGITIQSAAITFHWPPPGKHEVPDPYTINLIDTPGHADFTFEVLRSLRVLDGAVCILDGVAGVEAQTEKVWQQSRSYGIPAIFFVNKLDRDGAAFGRTVREIASKLQIWPAVCQIPWFQNGDGPLVGIVDIIHLRALKWLKGGDGTTINAQSIEELELTMPELAAEARNARKALVDLLSDRDDLMVEAFIECDDDYMAIAPEKITSSIRRCLLNEGSSFAPIFVGSSLKNIGVQPLIDAVAALLPSPDETPDPEFKAGSLSGGLRDLVAGRIQLASRLDEAAVKNKKNPNAIAKIQNLEACALAFKVVYDRHRGVMVYVRVYHGSLRRNAVIFNTNLQQSERATRVLRMYASDAVEVPSIEAGEIGVITGLKLVRTGDTLISYTGVNPKVGAPAPLNKLELRPIEIPPAVFFVGVEPLSQAEEKHTNELLDILLREDPSLQLSTNEDSGQRLLSGMGELHLEIAGNRLTQELNAKATMGKIEIGYRECPIAPGSPESVIFERQIVGRYGKAGCQVTVTTLEEGSDQDSNMILQDGNIIEAAIQTQAVEDSHIAGPPPGQLDPDQVRQALHNGALAALARGPAFAYQVSGAGVKLVFDPSQHYFGIDTNLPALTSAARKATQAALRSSHQGCSFAMAEPVMNVTITVNSESLGAVLKDLSSSRDGQIVSYDDESAVSSTTAIASLANPGTLGAIRPYAPPDPFEVPSIAGSDKHQALSDNSSRTITARVPLRSMVGYLPHLRSLTAGRGSFIMSINRFQKMPSHTQKAVLKEFRGL